MTISQHVTILLVVRSQTVQERDIVNNNQCEVEITVNIDDIIRANLPCVGPNYMSLFLPILDYFC